MKKVLGVLGLMILVLSMFVGCSNKDDPKEESIGESQEVSSSDVEKTDVEEVLEGNLVVKEGAVIDSFTSDFENENHEWLPRIGNEVLTLVSVAHSGNQSVEVSGRGESFQGIKLPLLGRLLPGTSYEIEAWVYQESGTTEEIALTMEKNEGTASYTRIGGGQAPSGEWTEITATYTYIENGEVSDLSLYFEAANNTMTFNIDDIKIKRAEAIEEKEVQMDLKSIYKTYEDYFSVGVAVGNQFLKDDKMKTLIKQHFNSVTAENSMKPEMMLDPSNRGDLNFSISDQYNAFAGQLNQGLRGHTLVWHNQTPDWFFKEDFQDEGALVSREVMLERLDSYMADLLGHYKKSNIYAWDVVNEVIADDGSGMRSSLWLDVVGPDFVEKAFEIARKYTEGTDTKLFYNDYNVVLDQRKQDQIYDLVKDLNSKGLIDGIGLQSHVNISGPSGEAFDRAIKRFGALGMEVQITELDISIYTSDDQKYDEVPEALLIHQAYRYKELFDVFKTNSEFVTNVTLWGLLDSQSWLKNFPVTRNNWPLLFDQDYQAKLAYYGIVDPAQLPEDVQVKTVALREPAKETVAIKGSPMIDGEIDAIWEKANEIVIDEFFGNDSGATAKARTMWDDQYLYVFLEVADATENVVSENPWEQDSIEIFIDELMNRTDFYEEDDVQYRVNRENLVTLNGGPEESMIVSATKATDTGYNVEVAIPFLKARPSEGVAIGFDLQVNDDAGSGSRDSIVKWNDVTDNGWKSTEGFGTLVLK